MRRLTLLAAAALAAVCILLPASACKRHRQRAAAEQPSGPASLLSMADPRAAALASGHFALADDSGLSVAALGGAPGIYSARWAGPAKDFSRAMARIERELREKAATDHAAHFTCALALCAPHGEMRSFVF